MALARFDTEPKVILLDEPLSALDAHLGVRMQALLRSLQRELGITFIYVTHSQVEAFSMADRVVVMSRGKVEQIGTPKQIYRQPATRFVADFIGNVNIFRGNVLERNGEMLSVGTPFGAMQVMAAQRNVAVNEEIDFFVNADQIRVGSDVDGRATVAGKLLSYKFVGNMVTLYLDLGDGVELKVTIPERVYDRLNIKIGDVVDAQWDADAAHLFQAVA